MVLPLRATPFSSLRVALMVFVAAVVLYEALETLIEVLILRTVMVPVAAIEKYS